MKKIFIYNSHKYKLITNNQNPSLITSSNDYFICNIFTYKLLIFDLNLF